MKDPLRPLKQGERFALPKFKKGEEVKTRYLGQLMFTIKSIDYDQAGNWYELKEITGIYHETELIKC
jgi:hypothetical protein